MRSRVSLGLKESNAIMNRRDDSSEMTAPWPIKRHDIHTCNVIRRCRIL